MSDQVREVARRAAETIADALGVYKTIGDAEHDPKCDCRICFVMTVAPIIDAAAYDAEKPWQRWVNDLQAGMYINCVYCGHRYGPDDEVPATMADALKEHVERCPEHPMSALKAENVRLRKELEAGRVGGEALDKDHANDAAGPPA